MKNEAKSVERAFEIVFDACLDIQERGACADCPLYGHLCLADEDFITIADLTCASSWKEFIDYADNACTSESDAVALHADRERKIAIEEAMIDEEYGI